MQTLVILLYLVFSPTIKADDILDALNKLPDPKKSSCEVLKERMAFRLDSNVYVQTEPSPHTSGLIYVLQMLADRKMDDPVFLSILRNAGYYDPASGIKAACVALSNDIKAHWIEIPITDRPNIELVHDQILVRINPKIGHINIFAPNGLAEFLNIAEQLPVDAHGIVVQGPLIDAALPFFRDHIEAVRNAYLVHAVYLSDRIKTVHYALRAKNISQSDALAQYYQLSRYAKEVEDDLNTVLDVIFKTFPHPTVGVSQRISARRVRSEQLAFWNTFESFATQTKKLLTDLKQEIDHPQKDNIPVVKIEDMFALYEHDKPAITRLHEALIAKGRELNLHEGFVFLHNFQLALNQFIRGNDESAKEYLKDLFREIEGTGPPFTKEDRNLIGKAAVAISKDLSVARLYASVMNVAEDTDYYPIEKIFYINSNNSTTPMPIFGKITNVLNVRMYQIEMARVVMQYGNLTNKSSLLEIGYGNPSVLKALRPIAPRRTVGVDLKPVPKGTTQELEGLELFQGNVPKDRDVAAKIKERGPYTVIYGLDVFKTQIFNLDVPVSEYLAWIADNLQEGGRFIILNDGVETIFSMEDIEKAGLKIIRWKVQRPMEPNEEQVMEKAFGEPVTRKLIMYVFQKGNADLSTFLVAKKHSK